MTKQLGNTVRLEHKDMPPGFSCSPTVTGTSGIPFAFQSKKKITLQCVFISFPFSKEIPHFCDELIDIDDVIAKYTSTERGKKAFKKAEDELHDELYREVLAGKLNRVKYHRLVNNMDQKTLAKLSGVKQPNISRIERPGYTADAETYKKLAKVFNINYKELLP